MSISRFLSSLAVTFLTIIGPALPAVAQSVASLDSRLSNPSLPAGASMGWRSDAMASDGDRVLLGAYSAERAFLFERTSAGTWVMASEFAPPQSAPRFGIGVAIWGDEVVVGASQVNVGGLTQVGRAFVYRRNSDGQWPLVQVLESPAQVSNAWFGGSIALSGDRMAIGTGGNASGAQLVAVYSRDASGQWVPEANIVSPDLGVPDGGFAPQFGFPVRLAGDLLLTADCDRDLPGAVDAGRGYVFRRHGQGLWMLESRLDHPAPAANDGNVSDAGSAFIAINVALGDSDAIVSFGGDDVGGNPDQGSAHVFVRSPAGAWTHQAALESGVGRAGDWMGWSTVRFVGNEALVGSVGWDGPDGASQQIGRVCRFIRSGATWSESPAIVDPGGSAGDRFGSGLAYGGGFLCISASRWSSGRGCGVVFGFGPDCDANGTADPLDVVRGAPDSNANRIPDQCECDAFPWTPACCVGNLNDDAAVDGADLGILLNAWGACGSACPADFNADGFVDGNDLSPLLANWGSCP